MRCWGRLSGRCWDFVSSQAPKQSTENAEGGSERRWWLGGRPATAKVMRAMLEAGFSPVLCPGGVRECLFLRHDAEVVFLRQRLGFVRIALQYGARPCLSAGNDIFESAGVCHLLCHTKCRIELLFVLLLRPRGACASRRKTVLHMASRCETSLSDAQSLWLCAVAQVFWMHNMMRSSGRARVHAQQSALTSCSGAPVCAVQGHRWCLSLPSGRRALSIGLNSARR